MHSPFPGMDPFIELCERWPDFHQDFLVGCREQLNRQLPSNYVASLSEQIQLLDEDEARARVVLPDVAVVHRSEARSSPQEARSTMATLAPRTLPQPEWIELPKQTYVEIIHLPKHRIVTDIELLPPSNKRKGSPDRTAYLSKRRDLLMQHIHLVELDLLIEGERLQMLAPLPAGSFHAFITRPLRPADCDVYSWSIRDPLPTIPIPLRDEDGEVGLNLATAFAQTYERGSYERVLDYDQSPTFLEAPDREWAGRLLSAR